MAAEHNFIRRVLSQSLAEIGADWHRLLHAVHQVCAQRSHDSEMVLKELLALEPDHDIRLRQGGQLPHALSAADMLRSIAIQTLAQWGLVAKYRAAIERVYAETDSDLLAEVARASLESA